MKLLVVAGVLVALATAGGTASARAESCEGQCEALSALADLRGTVEELVPQQGLATSLLAKVDAATNAVGNMRITPALNQLDAFGNEVIAAEQSGKTYETISNVLKKRDDAARQVIANL